MPLPLGLCTPRVWRSQALHFSGPTPAGHGSALNPVCSRQLGPSCALEAHRRTIPWGCCPFPTGWALPTVLLSQSGFRRREEAGFRPCCLHVLSRPPPPALHRAAKPVPLPNCDSRRPQLPELPVPAPWPASSTPTS